MKDTDQIHLRKNEGEVFGPMPLSELLTLADSAYVAPGDEISLDGKKWSPATDLPELEMVWFIEAESGEPYGPTTEGTVKEFLVAGEVTPEAKVRHVKTDKTCSVTELLGDEIVEQALNAAKQVAEGEMPEIERPLEVAKDLRIRRLETDLSRVRREYESLMQNYRKLTAELKSR